MSKANGELEAQKAATEHQAEHKKRQSAHQANLQQASAGDEFSRQKAEYLERLMETDMSDAGIRLLDNMVDRSWMLGNISDAEHHDFKWWFRCLWLDIKAEFPRPESGVTGDVRQFVLDDRDEGLEPLTGQQKIIIKQMLRALEPIVSRSVEGFQQEMNVKSISVSEVMDNDSDDDDLKTSLFGR